MINQKWIPIGTKSLFSVTRCNSKKADKYVIILPGFSLPMCDEDYFDSKLADELVEKGFYTIQVDLTGHGDSPGSLEDVTLKALKNELKEIVRYLKEETKKKIYVVGRGINPVLLAEMIDDVETELIIGLNPYTLSPNYVSSVYEVTEAGVLPCSVFLDGSDYSNLSDFNKDKMLLLEALGARIRNLHGQSINTDLLNKLVCYDPIEVIKNSKKCKWIVTDRAAEEGYKVVDNEFFMEDASFKPFVRDPLWQWNVIQKICELIQKH